MYGALMGVAGLVSGAAHAADLGFPVKAAPVNDDDFLTRPYLFGDLGRERLKQMGLEVTLQMYDEAVANATGGTKNNTAQAGQAWLTAKFDLQKLAGLQGSSIFVNYVQRFGQNLNTTAGIPALQLTNEVFGRGNILRELDFYWDQKLLNNTLELKVGRMPVGDDFFFAKCEFINLTFCGGAPGNILGGYIFNWPVSQWGGVAHYNVTKDVQLSVGVYDANPNYLSTSDASVYALPGFPSSNPADGTLVTYELTWNPSFGGKLPGTWRLGGWYDNTQTIDGNLPGAIAVLPNADPGIGDQALSGQRGRYGFYESIFQQMTSDGPRGQGWYGFLNTTIGDHRTSYQDYEVALGFKHTGTFSFRPADEVGFAVGTTHVNSAAVITDPATGLVTSNFNPNAGGNEVPFEAWYGWQATGWLNLKFDLQYVIDPGGRGYVPGNSPTGFVKTDNAWIFGLRTTVNF